MPLIAGSLNQGIGKAGTFIHAACEALGLILALIRLLGMPIIPIISREQMRRGHISLNEHWAALRELQSDLHIAFSFRWRRQQAPPTWQILTPVDTGRERLLRSGHDVSFSA
jgi:hypothetical protein